ncbi:hypothetical protein MBA17_23135 [Streptosporangium sp. KLBMP 9127]|nr:hypothetical protein [Streptosporangium sp. KLBMP 9127]
MAVEPLAAVAMVTHVGIAGVVGGGAPGLAVHATVAQIADHVGAERVTAMGLRVAVEAGAGTRATSGAADRGDGLEEFLGDQGLVGRPGRPDPLTERVELAALLGGSPVPHHVSRVLGVAQDLPYGGAAPSAQGPPGIDGHGRRILVRFEVEPVGDAVVAEPVDGPQHEDVRDGRSLDRMGDQTALGAALGPLGSDRVGDLLSAVAVAGLPDVPALLGVLAEAVPRQLQELEDVPLGDRLLYPAGKDRSGALA